MRINEIVTERHAQNNSDVIDGFIEEVLYDMGMDWRDLDQRNLTDGFIQTVEDMGKHLNPQMMLNGDQIHDFIIRVINDRYHR